MTSHTIYNMMQNDITHIYDMMQNDITHYIQNDNTLYTI